MKNTNWIRASIILIIIIVGYAIYTREFKSDKIVIKPSQMVIDKSVWDSIKSIASLKPEIHIDTVRVSGEPVIVERYSVILDTVYINNSPFTITYTDGRLKAYKDSIVNPDINMTIIDTIDGELKHRTWRYVPQYLTIHQLKTEYVPRIVTQTIEVSKPQYGVYLYGLTGGNANAFIYGAGVNYIDKKDRSWGYQYQRWGKTSFNSLKFGIKIKKPGS